MTENTFLRNLNIAKLKIKEKFKRKEKTKSEVKKEIEKKSSEVKKALRKKRKKLTNRQILRTYLTKAGLEHISEKKIKKNIITIAIAICVLLTLGAVTYWWFGGQTTIWAGIAIVAIWTVALIAAVGLSWLALYFFLDLHIFKRTMELETVLPDFLQLTSANISAGMPIDRALWYAVRPNFGVLAKEIEDVAKHTVAGEDLEKALLNFSSKYDSQILKQSMNILLEGLRAGGEMADLLNKIAINIQETRLMRKEMAANVMTYVIFIGFATAVAAPFLYALATLLLKIITQILSGIDISSTAGSFGLSFGDSAGIKISDFRWFCVTMLTFTSTASAMIISMIRKGNIKEGLRYIPIFIFITLSLYFLSFWAFDGLFSDLL